MEQRTYLDDMLEIFKLDDLYNLHKDVAEELIIKSVHYNTTRKAELEKIFIQDFGIKNPKDMIKQM